MKSQDLENGQFDLYSNLSNTSYEALRTYREDENRSEDSSSNLLNIYIEKQKEIFEQIWKKIKEFEELKEIIKKMKELLSNINDISFKEQIFKSYEELREKIEKNERKLKEIEETLKNYESSTEGVIIKDIDQLKEIKKENLYKVRVINLEGKNLQDISFFPISLPNLENLNLSKNKLDDKCINYFQRFDYPKLTTLDLYNNCFKSASIISLISEKFPKLKEFYIGLNRFEKNFEEKIINFNELEILGLTRGVFKKIDIEKFWKYIRCKKLKVLYLALNEIKSLNFMKGIELPKLEEIWINANKLYNFNDFEVLQKFKSLRLINLRDNHISNIYWLQDFVKNFNEGLKTLNLYENRIVENKTNLKIFEEVKKEKGIELITNKEELQNFN